MSDTPREATAWFGAECNRRHAMSMLYCLCENYGIPFDVSLVYERDTQDEGRILVFPLPTPLDEVTRTAYHRKLVTHPDPYWGKYHES